MVLSAGKFSRLTDWWRLTSGLSSSLTVGMLEHDREIDEETQNRADRSVCPVNITDKQEENGWIAEYLKFLDSLLRPLLGSV